MKLEAAGFVFKEHVPDMDIYTEGRSLANAIEMARDAIGLKGIDLEDDKKELPIPYIDAKWIIRLYEEM